MMFRLTPILLLLASLSGGTLPAFAANEITCDATDPFIELGFDWEEAKKLCHTVPEIECWQTIDKVGRSSGELRSKRSATCDHVEKLMPELAGVSSQRDSAAQSARLYGQLLGDYNDYIALLSQSYNAIRGTLLPPTGPLGAPQNPSVITVLDGNGLERQDIRIGLQDSRKMPNVKLRGSAAKMSDVTGTDGKPDAKVYAGRNGTLFMQKIIKEKLNAEKSQKDLKDLKEKAEANAAGLAPTPDPQNPRDPKGASGPSAASGSGLDLKSLAGLATAGAGLAQMMNKKDSSVTDPPAAPPTPPSAAGPGGASKEGPAVSKFGDGKSGPAGPLVGAPGPKKDGNTTAHVPGATGYRENSDISKNTPSGPLSNGTSNPASGKATGSQSGGPSSRGGTEGEAAAGKRDPSAAGEHKDEDTQGINGGALGGGGPPSMGGNSSAPPMPTDPAAAATPEDSMKDLLHEMKETAEGGPPGETQAAADIAMDDQDLFPRVRACYVRSLKKGRVLNGLGEKITPEPE